MLDQPVPGVPPPFMPPMYPAMYPPPMIGPGGRPMAPPGPWMHDVCILLIAFHFPILASVCLQCFDAVSWVTGRASGLPIKTSTSERVVMYIY